MDGEVDPEELAALLDEEDGADGDADGSEDDEGGLRIVDIRDRRAFDRGHLPGSECVPFPELTTRVEGLTGASRIVTVCPHGIASRQAAQLIGSYAGIGDARVESLRGGVEAWQRDVGELETTDGESGEAGEADERDGGTDEGPDAPF
ncbi:rhodanese [Halorubrum sp. Ib24]|uniref:rhodanese-like domain-containing protein n=1 Tax=unclassified Halorubrum TaxID=2642239 RepID=UPI000B9912A8|nr:MULTISPECIES: rhodanese-like domain-containing protein [unclassified Halorubrum]OYR38421.1 rhodanese [Halorubrum sp. Ib24]OYR40644.1 rhodanese [Halorubrum sp. Hd13]OYR47545.1 rhodanese [Halorubrum sp. Ea8]OYR48152.1 rhodanese [Halorubrum sp. Eb13]OYR55500.1 rhodanese [Halorubrum sp. Ea1]